MVFILSLESSQLIYKSKVYRWMHQWKERKKTKEEGRKKGVNWIFSGTNLNQQVLESKIKCPGLLSLCGAVLRCAIRGSLKGSQEGWDLDAHSSLTHFYWFSLTSSHVLTASQTTCTQVLISMLLLGEIKPRCRFCKNSTYKFSSWCGIRISVWNFSVEQ